MGWRGVEVLESAKPLKTPGEEGMLFVEGVSPLMRAVSLLVQNVAPTDFPVLLMGESGSGKEAVALHIHRQSRRAHEPFTKVACGAVKPESFDVLRRKAESNDAEEAEARLGTLFLDEITDLSALCQAALVTALPDDDLAAPGHAVRARIISTTSRGPLELDDILQRGTLRKDLFYRINGVSLRLPPLRERKEDIPALVEFFLKRSSSALSRPVPTLSAQLVESFQAYSWPGNIRELENAVKKIVALGHESAALDWGMLARDARGSNGDDKDLSLKEAARAASRQAEKELILKVLERTHWNRKRAARQLQVSYKALLYKLRQMGLDKSGSL
jgi:two-component system, NtrC family, response regulator AtoC